MTHLRRGMLALVASLACVACAAPGASQAPAGAPSLAPPSWPDDPVDAATLTAYDAAMPLDVREEDEPREEDGIAIHDVTWASPHGGRASAWLVVPPGEGPFGGIVYLHGSETWRDDFLDEAIAMAHGGAISLVVDAPFARMGAERRPSLGAYDDPEEERGMTAQAIVDVRRAYDVLAARDDVDDARLGFVGHSWGASLGVVLAAVDPRPSSLVLITGRPSWTGFLDAAEEEWVQATRDGYTPAQWEHYLELMAPLDAMAEIGNVDGQRLYLQYGSEDDVVPPRVARELIDAADADRTDSYEAGHALNDQATADRVGWLVERLRLQPVPGEVLATVGLPDE